MLTNAPNGFLHLTAKNVTILVTFSRSITAWVLMTSTHQLIVSHKSKLMFFFLGGLHTLDFFFYYFQR